MIYFDNAATTFPKPGRVCRKVTEAMIKYGANPGRSGHTMAMRAGEEVYECRELVSGFFGLDNPSNVIFTLNATHALNIVISGILEKGDHAVCTVMDHNSVLRPMFAKMPDTECSFVDADGEGFVCIESVEKELKANTKLVVMTHISNVCGTINPISEVAKLCRKRGILFMVDASQSAGVVSINMKKQGIDFLALPGHKALYGPMGTGVLCINTQRVPKPIIFGGTGSYSKELSQPAELPDSLESGTLNLPGICGLGEGIRFVREFGTENIFSHEMKLTSFLLDGLSEIEGIKVFGKKTVEGRSGVVSFTMEGKDSTSVAGRLDSDFGICVRSMYHCAYKAHEALGSVQGGTVRVSFGAFNRIGEVKKLLYGLKHI